MANYVKVSWSSSIGPSSGARYFNASAKTGYQTAPWSSATDYHVLVYGPERMVGAVWVHGGVSSSSTWANMVGQTVMVSEPQGTGYHVDNPAGSITSVQGSTYTHTLAVSNGGSVYGSSTVEIVEGAVLSGSNVTGTASDSAEWSFVRWAGDITATGVSFSNGGRTCTINKSAAQNIYIYAEWTPRGYTVTLNANGGAGGTASVTATYGSAMPQITPPTRTGYTFNGYWYDPTGKWTDPSQYVKYYNADGSSAHNWDIASATTLYAGWTPNTYTITLDRQSGSGGTASVTATYGAAMPSITVPTRTGYTFGGYYTSTGGGGTQYYTATGTSARTWNLTAATPLYAKWTANKCTVTLNKQSGSGGTNSVTATYGETLPAPISLPTRTGYAFRGYYTGTDGTGTQYYSWIGYSFKKPWQTASSTATLYAYWTANRYSIIVDPCGGVFRGSATPYAYDISEKWLETDTATNGYVIHTATRTGYALVGYYDAKTGGDIVYGADGRAVDGKYWNGSGSTAKFKAPTSASATSLTVYARWTANTYKLAVHANGGTYRDGVSADYVYPDDDPNERRRLQTGSTALNLLFQAVRSGFVLAGYYTSASGGTMVYDAAGRAVQGDYWTDDYAHGGTFKGLAAGATQLDVYARWLASVTVSMSAVCGDTDAQGSIPDAAGSPTVKIGGVSGEVSVSAVATQGDGLVVYASAEVEGMEISRITARDAGGVLVDMEVDPDDAVDGFCKASLVPRATDVTVRAVYSRNPVSVSVAKGSASASLSPSPHVDPPAVQYRFGDVVSFITDGSATGSYPFFCWSDSPDAPTAAPDESATAATYRVTLTGDTALYAHYAKVVGVSKLAVDSTGAATEDEGGGVLVYALGVEHAVPGAGLTGLAVPFGGSVRIVSTADVSDGYRFLGIKFRSGQSERDTGYASDETFQPEGNGTYEVTFQKNPPDVYLACADVAEADETGTVGQTVAVYNGTEEGAFEPVDGPVDKDGNPITFENAPAGARWYKVRAGTVVTLVASRSSEADALSWKGVEYVDLVEEGEAVPTPPEYDTGDGDSQEEVWRNRSYAVSGNRAVVTTWGNYPSPKVTLAARTGGSAAFKGEDPDLHEKTYEADYDSETGIYAYQTATVVAEASDGHVFVGWYSANLAQVVSDAAEYSFEVRQDESLEAVFRKDDNAVFEWEGGTSKKMVEWRSGVMTVPKPADPVAARVDATGYPVEFDVGTYSSHDAEPTRQHAVEIASQDGRRLPRLRPERFWRMSVRARTEIDAVAVATNIAEVN